MEVERTIRYSCLLLWIFAGCKSPGPTSPTAASPAEARPAPVPVAEKPAPAPAQPEPAALKEPPAPAANALAPNAPAPNALSPELASALEQLRWLDSSVPRTYWGIRRPDEETLKRVLAAIEASTKLLAEAPSADCSGEVKAIRARMELVRLPLQRDAWLRQGLTTSEVLSKSNEQLKLPIALATEAAATCPRGSAGHTGALEVLVYLQEQVDDFEASRRAAQQLIKDYPEHPGRPDVQLTVARDLIYQSRYQDAVKYLDDLIREHEEDVQYVLYNELLFEALTGVGDLERLEELMNLIRAEYPDRAKGLPEGDPLRWQYELWSCRAPFWIGFSRLALGNNAGARDAFNQHVAEGDLRVEKAAAEGRKLGQDPCTVELNFRTRGYLDFLDTFHGTTPQLDLDRAELWASKERMTLRESRGKVVAIVARMPKNQRSATFLQAIDSLARKHKDKLAAVTVGYVSGPPNPQEDEILVSRWREDLTALNVSLPAAFDPDRVTQSFFRQIDALVGSPSFVVLDKKGQIAWLLQDPRDLDREIARRVIERLMVEP